MADSDLIKLYSGRILALASDIPLTDRLDAPQATVRKRSPQCGSSVTVDLILEDGKIVAFGQDVRACALGQAAASIVGAHVIGSDEATLLRAQDQLREMLTRDAVTPAHPFEEYEVLRPAAAFKNRHASILLALDATVEAIAEAKAKSACA